MSTKGDELLEEIYKIIAETREGVIQSELWKKIGISSRKGSKIVRELVRRGLVTRRKVLRGGRWTYLLKLRDEEEGLGIIRDLYCLRCPVENKCSEESPNYLITCVYLEEWALDRYEERVEEEK